MVKKEGNGGHSQIVEWGIFRMDLFPFRKRRKGSPSSLRRQFERQAERDMGIRRPKPRTRRVKKD